MTTPQGPMMGVSDEAQQEAQGAVACYRLVRSVFRTAWLDGDVCAEDEAKLRDATFTVERAYTTAPVDVRVVDEPMVVRALNAMVPGSDLGDAFGRWNVASFIACNEAPFTEVSRHDVMRAALKAALLSAQPSAEEGEFQPVGYVTEEGANYYAENFGTVSLKPKNGTEIFAAIAAQREAGEG